MSGHTPGPWKAMPEEADKPYIRVRGARLGRLYKIANVLGVDNEFDAGEAAANARLIAAAPALLEALLIAREFAAYAQAEPADLALIDAAIRQATEGDKA